MKTFWQMPAGHLMQQPLEMRDHGVWFLMLNVDGNDN